MDKIQIALEQSIKLIKQWHNMQGFLARRPENEIEEVWQIYYNNAPEMKPIKAAFQSVSEHSSAGDGIEMAKLIYENNQAERERSDTFINAIRGKPTKAEILAKVTGHHADLLETAFLNNEAVTPKEAFEAMEQWASPVSEHSSDDWIWTDELIKKMIYQKLPLPEHYFGNMQKCLDEFKESELSPVKEEKQQ